jgi:hypothetical protein
MSGLDLSPELAAALDRLVPAEPLTGDWEGVVARVERRTLRARGLGRPRWRTWLVVALLALVLLLAGVATATYLIVRGPGRLTVMGSSAPPTDVARVEALDAHGRVRTVWQCPHERFCGELVSVAWAPDGRRLALSVTTIVATSLYDGVHILDVATGADSRLPRPPAPASTTRTDLGHANVQLVDRERRLFGCDSPRELAWSPAGTLIAYVCDGWPRSGQPGRIYTIRPDGTGRTLVPTTTDGAYWPSWSPDGRQIAFSSGDVPSQSAVYTVGLDGSDERLVTQGSAPDWSPDGSTIAYRAKSCAPESGPDLRGSIRLVTPAGTDVTPAGLADACERLGPFEWPVPAWSPDGRRLAIGTGDGLYVVDRDGSGLREVDAQVGGGLFGQERPAWQPRPTAGAR